MTEQSTNLPDALVHEIGALILADERVSARAWDGYALVVRFDQTQTRLSGFAYEHGHFHPATPRSTALQQRLQALRDAMRQDGSDPWAACVIRIVRATKQIRIEFEYDHPEQWDITPETLNHIATRARP